MSAYAVPTLTGVPDFSVRVPGSKSLTNRALPVAALAHGESILEGVLQSDDTRYMLKALDELGMSRADMNKLLFMLFPEGPFPAKNYSYLDDYVYINNVQFTHPHGGQNKKIVAYEKRICKNNGTRSVGFDDGSVMRFHYESQVRKLFESQGLEYPGDAKPKAGD